MGPKKISGSIGTLCYCSDLPKYQHSMLLYHAEVLLVLCLLQVADFYVSHEKQQLLKRLNTVSLVLGLLGSLGVSIVGNFQETSVVVAHFIGASLCFGLGTIYLWIQVYSRSEVKALFHFGTNSSTMWYNTPCFTTLKVLICVTFVLPPKGAQTCKKIWIRECPVIYVDKFAKYRVIRVNRMVFHVKMY